jgi:chemosensory pili system protein ChpA (sensor histidine kinase/response regulator)
MQTNQTPAIDGDAAMSDLGPLAWVLDELRKSLDGATKALRRFVRDADSARGSDLADVDASQLRIARQQLHQAVGALEMVGLGAPAKVLRAMEALAQKFVQRPELCSDDAANKVERASFALTEYLEGVLKGKTASAVALFPQYRDVLELVGGDRVHPADLWPQEWRWIDAPLAMTGPALAYGPEVRARVDQAVLKVVRSGDAQAAKVMTAISLGLAQASGQLEPRVFWKISAAFFEALGSGLCPSDVFVKRTASRIIAQYTTLARGEPGVIDRLAQDLLFYCAQAIPSAAADTPTLIAVRQAYGLTRTRPFEYSTPQFGRFDPALLVQARKRISTATETWAALAGGDTNRLKAASDQFGAVAESMMKLHPESSELARALTRAVEATVRSSEPPPAPVAMEVATSVLYLEAAYDDLDPTESHMAERCARLAQRLDHVVTGAQPQPLEVWMEDLYRRVSDRQTMGSVVDELRTTLGQVEKSLDQFFRNPQDRVPLHEVPSQLAQMRGVFSVLGLDQASLAALRMRDSVEKFLVDQIDIRSAGIGIFEKLGNSLGAMGFLIDMLSYQRALAKKLFIYDEEAGEFRPVMGRDKLAMDESAARQGAVLAAQVETDITSTPIAQVDPEPAAATAAVSVVPDMPAPPVAPVVVSQPLLDDDDAEMRDIFLEEAREVVQTGLQALKALAASPDNLGQQTTLRRAFHTLKGSSRMVGLTEFGEAAWALEQLVNTWLAEQKPASEDLLLVCDAAMQQFGRWVEDIASGASTPWSAPAFRKAADGLRLDNQRVTLEAPGAHVAEALPSKPAPPAVPEIKPEEVELPLPSFESTQMFETPAATPQLPRPDFQLTQTFDGELPPAGAGHKPPAVSLDLDDFDFGAQGAGEPQLVFDESPDTAETVQPAHVFAADGDTTDAGTFAAHADSVAGPASETPDVVDDQIKVIGDLRIGIPLYNVYLNEADEWSRRLLTELSEWQLELDQPVLDSTIGLAHSLGGSSATVGFRVLSDVAKLLEQALCHVQLHGQGLPEHARVFNEAAEEIRRLLHQFAAGFLKEPDPAVPRALQAILETQFPIAELESPVSPVEPAPVVRPKLQVETGAAQLITVADEETDVVDALDADLFPIFEEEAADLFPQLGGALRQWVSRPENLGARNEALRVLHTLKGSSRLAGALRLGEMTHRMESAIEALGSETFQSSQIEPMLARFDGLQSIFDGLRRLAQQAHIPVEGQAEPQEIDATATDAAPTAANAVMDRRTRGRAGGGMAPARTAGSQTLRVSAQLLDRLINQAGEVIITRSRLEAGLGQMRTSLKDLTGNLDRLREQLREIELQSESQMQSRMAQTKDHAQEFDPLEFDRFTRVQELTRIMAESVSDVATVQRNLQRTMEGTEDDLITQARQARELQRDLLRTRMVEFEGISERLYGVVRQASKDTGKQVKLDIIGGSMDLDRSVLERMAPAFEHMLRNAVAHGIETPEQRVAAGKAPVGAITIELRHEGNDVSVEFSDDGAGLDLKRIYDKAITHGLVSPGSVLGNDEISNLIFAPGFSTAEQITELSGRGIGLDVVRSEVNALGGRIETSARAGAGTTFKLVVPLTTAVTQVVMLRLGDLAVGVPSNLVEIVRRVPSAEVAQAYQSNTFTHGSEQIPFYWAGALLQASALSQEPVGRHLAVVVFRSAGQRVAAHVDEVLGNQEVVVKNLGPQLSRVPGLTGMSVLASGAVVLIYNLVALATVYGEQALQMQSASRQVPSPSGQSPEQSSANDAQKALTPVQTPLVMVVDDSITVRRVTQRLLKREGYRVVLANDGLQALERLQEELPAVILSDIEMPRMDGFDLARNIRGDERLRDLPIIMITSRIAEKHRDRARELGVDHYLGKPYSEEELLGLIRNYCALPLDADSLV